MKLSEQVQKTLTYIQQIEVPSNLSQLETGRAFYEQFIPLAGTKEAVHLIEEQTITTGKHAIRLRIYRPNDRDKQPAIVYFHGGWFNAGSLETHDTPLRQLANASQTTVIAVSYRLAPEHPFPAGLNDGEFATQWILDNAARFRINPSQLMIAGDSAGGALAATIARKFKEKVVAQILIYPVTDNSLKTASWLEFQNGPILNLQGGIQAWDWYLPQTEDQTNPDAVPLLADDLEALPPTFIAVAEYDPLKDEAVQYAEKLRAKGVHVNLKRYEGMIHGFFQMGGMIDDAAGLIQDLGQFIKENQTQQ